MGKSAIIETLRQYFTTQPVLKAWLFLSQEGKKRKIAMLIFL